jgi:hypothetical protein
MNSKDYNHIIRMANRGTSKKEAEKELSPEELKLFTEISNELNEARKTDPKACFWPVESEW